MEVAFAITGKDYVILAADQNASRSVIKMKGDEDKIKALGSHLLMAYSGEPGKSQPLYFLIKLFNSHSRRYGSIRRICRA
jgi:20S proteasome alpha/beta subunit